MNEGILYYQDSKLHYEKSGTGSQVLLAFHGFGQDKSYFDELIKIWSDTYTIYTFDIYFHGESFWPNGKERPLTKADWQAIIKAFVIQEDITRFSLVGFSMGGKFVLATLENFADHVNEVTLIAPDGIKTSFWYSLATYPLFFRKIFENIIHQPKPYYALLKTLRSLRLMDKSLLKFAKFQMDTPRKRQQVYDTWVSFRLLSFDMAHIAQLINSKHIDLTMYLGKYDQIISEKNMDRLLSKLHQYQLHILDCGHNNLLSALAKHLKKA